MGWKGHCYGNGRTTQRDLQVQCDMDQNVNGFVYFFEERVSESAALNSLKMTLNFWPFCLHLLSVGTTGVQQMKTGFSVIF